MKKKTKKILKIYIASALFILSSLYYCNFWLFKSWEDTQEKFVFDGSVFLFLISLLTNYLYQPERRLFFKKVIEEVKLISWDNIGNIRNSVFVSITVVLVLSSMIGLIDILPRYILRMLSEFYTHSLT